MPSHWHNPTAPTQNSGNVLGTRPCVRLSESYMKQFSGEAAANFTGGSPCERIPPSARFNPHAPQFYTPEAAAHRMDAGTPPRRSNPLDSRNPNSASSQSIQSAKDAFWSGSSVTGLIYGDDSPPSKSSVRHEPAQYSQAPTHAAYQPYQPGERMENNLMAWARDMGLTVPPELDDAPEVRSEAPPAPTVAWPASAEEAYGVHGREYGYHEAYRPVLPGYEVPYGVPKPDQGRGFHQRARARRSTQDKIKAGNGDIITWSQLG